jgi:hypothetical protein
MTAVPTSDSITLVVYPLHYLAGPTSSDALADLSTGLVQIYFYWPGTIPQESLDSLTQEYGFKFRRYESAYFSYASFYNGVVWHYLDSLKGKDWPQQRKLLEETLGQLELKHPGPKGLKPPKPFRK